MDSFAFVYANMNGWGCAQLAAVLIRVTLKLEDLYMKELFSVLSTGGCLFPNLGKGWFYSNLGSIIIELTFTKVSILILGMTRRLLILQLCLLNVHLLLLLLRLSFK